MLTNNQLRERLAAVSRRHNDLKARFAEFAGLIEASLPKPDFFVKGITVKPVLDSSYVEVSFAGRILRFVFSSSVPEPNRTLAGSVQCYLVLEVPDKNLAYVGGFSFKPDGETDVKAEPDGDPLYMNWDTAAIYLALHLINESLSR